MLAITRLDIEQIRQSRARERYKDFSDEQRTAHQRVHAVLGQLGHLVVDELGGSRDYALKLTSGFHPDSGVRGGKPKDLWFGVYRKDNEKRFLGNPQVFMIISERGIEYGFSPLTHPDDFSNADIKQQTREIAPLVLQQLPAPSSPDARDLLLQLSRSSGWHFRRKQRLQPGQSEFKSLDDWLSFVRSDEGLRNAGGGITRYVLFEEIGTIDLVEAVREMARIFRPLMDRIVAGAPPATAPSPNTTPPRKTAEAAPDFAKLLQA